jgi:hypothetical protein
MLIPKTTLIAAALLACLVAAPAFAQVGRTIDPDTLPPAQREYALHGNLYDHDPTGGPTDPGCLWGRIQVPTSQGLRWLDQEECNPNSSK